MQNMTMKMNKTMGMALIAALIAGSALAGAKEAQRSTDSLKATQTEVQDAYNQITATIGSLGTLMSAQVGDLTPMLKDFNVQVKQLQADAESARSRAIKMQDMNKEYFAAWAQEIASISDPAIKAQSQARLQESFANYQKVEQGLVQTRDSYIPLISSLTDLQTALTTDLSPAGKAALQPSFAKARGQAVATQGAMQTTKAAIQVALGGLTPRASGFVE
jgi:ATP-dependent Clp protease ATP-binding subunit ClpA